MNSKAFINQFEQVQPLLAAFLEQLLGEPAPLDLKAPEPVSNPAVEQALAQGHLVHFAASTGTHAVVVLDTAWVAALAANLQSEGSTDDEEAWLRTVATQGYEAVRSQLVGVASLPEVSIQLLPPESVQAHLSEPVYRIPFHLASSFQTLDGFVLLSAAETATILQPAPSMPDSENTIAPAAFPDLGRETLGGDGSPGNLDLLADIELEVTVELGQRRLSLAEVLRLSTGSVVELEKVVGEPLEVYANGRLIAEGEAVVIDEHFGIRITRLVSGR